MNATHTLARIEVYTDAEYDALSWQAKRDFKRSPAVWKAPTLPKFIPAPDYSTHEAVTQRCYEAGGWTGFPADGSDRGAYRVGQWWLAGKSLAKDYAAFRKACGVALTVDPFDHHKSRWRVVWNADARQWDLTDEPEPVPTPAPARKRKARAA